MTADKELRDRIKNWVREDRATRIPLLAAFLRQEGIEDSWTLWVNTAPKEQLETTINHFNIPE